MYWTLNKKTHEAGFHTNMKMASEATDFSYDQLNHSFGRKKETEKENENFYVGKESDISVIMKSYAEKVNPKMKYVGDYNVRFEGVSKIVKLYCITEDQ